MNPIKSSSLNEVSLNVSECMGASEVTPNLKSSGLTLSVCRIIG
jgi:hypothetical protein